MGVKILVDAGHEVVAVSNGAAAVKKIASEKPQLVVLDVYMPGYTGLEVCERMKSAPETANTPVLLTVGKMEPFKAEEATRVKADGVLVKPFEASDLLAAVKKIEDKLSTAAVEEAPADYEKTVKLNVAEMFKQDSSYQEWQVAAPEHTDEPTQSGPVRVKTEVPAESAGDAVFGDMLADEGPEAKAAALEAAPTPAAYATAPSVAVTPVAPPLPAEPAPIALETAPNTQKYEAPAGAHRDGEIEPTAGWGKQHVEHAPDPHFEPTVSQDRIEVDHHAKDPALVTDPAEMATAFVTKFGVENAETIPVGVASEANIPGLYTDSATTEAVPAEEEPPTQDVSASVGKLEATEEEADSVELVEEGESVPAPAGDDDFEKRVAAAMSGYEPPAAPAPEPELAPTVMSQAPVMEAAPAPEPEPAPVVEAAAPVPEPEPAPVAVAAAAAADAGWAAQEAPIAEHEAATSLDQEMLKAFSASLPEPEPPAPEPEPVVEAAAPAPEPVAAATPAPANIPDIELAKSLAAAVAPDAGPGTIRLAATEAAAAAGGSIDPAKLAEAIHRALDQLKPDLIARIAKELEHK
jgi:CheY-like chemotaxis protein